MSLISVNVYIVSHTIGYGVFYRGASGDGYPWPVAAQGEDTGGTGTTVQAVHRPLRGSPQQIHLPYGLVGE